MQIEQSRWSQATGWEPEFPDRLGLEARFVSVSYTHLTLPTIYSV